MVNKKKYTKKISRKFAKNKKTYKRKQKTSRKYKRKNKNNKIYFGGNGGIWLDSSQIDDKNECCSLCCQEFSETPDQAIYKTECGHLFHNNCLYDICEHKVNTFLEERNGELVVVCPLCRTELDSECNDTMAFREKLLDENSINKYLTNDKVKEIYNNQS